VERVVAGKKKQQKTNDELAAEYAAKLAEHEEAQKAKAKVFDPKLLVARGDKITTVVHPVLGLLKFGELTFEDAFEINEAKTDVEKTEVAAWLMMRKAYPDIPKDFLKRMPLIEGAALIDFLTKQPAFLSARKISAVGSKRVRKRKTSV
jgi:hypothetical protein